MLTANEGASEGLVDEEGKGVDGAVPEPGVLPSVLRGMKGDLARVDEGVCSLVEDAAERKVPLGEWLLLLSKGDAILSGVADLLAAVGEEEEAAAAPAACWFRNPMSEVFVPRLGRGIFDTPPAPPAAAAMDPPGEVAVGVGNPLLRGDMATILLRGAALSFAYLLSGLCSSPSVGW